MGLHLLRGLSRDLCKIDHAATPKRPTTPITRLTTMRGELLLPSADGGTTCGVEVVGGVSGVAVVGRGVSGIITAS